MKALWVSVCALLLLVAIAANIQAAPPVSGAIFTTNADCTATNANIYAARQDVYLNGGPRKAGAAGLPDGLYYVQVTEPNGTVLGSSIWTGTQRPISVVGGEFAQCYQLWAILNTASNHAAQGYDLTGNNGGEYKVWVSNESNFANNSSKTDNFKVREELPPPPPPATDIVAFKFYDLDLDGNWGSTTTEPPIANWPIELRLAVGDTLVAAGVTDTNGQIKFTVLRDSTEYIVREVMQQPYVNTTDLEETVVANQETVVVAFGNVAIQCHLGLGRTHGFWGNPNGKAKLQACYPDWVTTLNTLHLVDGSGADFVIPTTSFEDAYSAFHSWNQGANATNMAYMLSAQMATMVLNVECGFMSGFPGIFVNWQGTPTNLQDVFADADELLRDFPVTVSASAERTLQEEYKNFFDLMNNNDTSLTHAYMVLPGPVAFGPLPCVQPPSEEPPPMD